MKRTDVPDIKTAGLEKIAIFSMRLKEENFFNLKDCGISSKTFHDWRNVDIVPPDLVKKEGEGYKDIKLTFFEWIWFQIVKELRLLGISYKNIKMLRDECWKEVKMEDIVRLIQDKAINEEMRRLNKDLEPLNNEIKKIEFSKEDMEEAISSYPYKKYVIECLIETCLFQKQEIKVLFRYDGEFFVLRDMGDIKLPDENFSILKHYNEEFAPYPHFSIPLMRYVNSFFLEEEVFKHMPKLGFVNSDEFEVLELIRHGGLKELTIKMDKKLTKIKGYEYKKDGDISRDDMLKITKTFFLKEYESVSFKWKNNRTVYFERTTKKQL